MGGGITGLRTGRPAGPRRARRPGDASEVRGRPSARAIRPGRWWAGGSRSGASRRTLAGDRGPGRGPHGRGRGRRGGDECRPAFPPAAGSGRGIDPRRGCAAAASADTIRGPGRRRTHGPMAGIRLAGRFADHENGRHPRTRR